MLSQPEFRKLPIFITSMSRWDGAVSSASLALAKVFARTNEVFYIDYPYSIADALREYETIPVKRRMPALLYGKNYLKAVWEMDRLIAVTPKLVLPTFSLPNGIIYNSFSHYNNLILANLIKKIVKERGISEYIFINSFNPGYLSNIHRYLQPALTVYQSRDAIEDVSERWLFKENECIQNYDIALATSKELCHNISTRNNRTVHYLPNGGDIAMFKTAVEQNLPKPPELTGIKTPIIGYTGAVCQRIDYELLSKIAKVHRDKTIVIVGPRYDNEHTSINLDELSNIVFIGPKKINELPAYLKYFSCTIIPFKKNNFTSGIYPLKINEYLGAGKPVVATNFSEDIASFAECIYLADSHDEFLLKVQQALTDNSIEKQRARLVVAESNSWEHRVERYWQLTWNAYLQKAHVPGKSKTLVNTSQFT